MGGRHSRNKGHNFEREIAQLLKTVFPHVKRKLEYQASEATGVDLEYTGNFKFQCKRLKTSVPIAKIEEIKEDGVHVLVSKTDQKPIYATMKFEDFIKLLQCLAQMSSIAPGSLLVSESSHQHHLLKK